MAVGSIDGGFRAGLLQRLFQRADSDLSQSVGVDELSGLLSGNDAPAGAQSILASQDADGNGQLTLAEFTSGNLAPETLSSLLTRQEYKDADRATRLADDRKAADEFFASADIDGNGELSREEFDAERTLRLAQSLDAGEDVPQHLFATMRPTGDDDVITRDQIMVGRRLIDVTDAVPLDDPSLDPKLVERLKNLHLLKPDADAEAEAPATPPVDTPRSLGDVVRSAELTQTLIARLIQQLELGVPPAPTQDFLA